MTNKKQVYSIKCDKCGGIGFYYYKEYAKRFKTNCKKCNCKGFVSIKE